MPISSISKFYLTLSRYSITTSPQGDDLLILYPGTTAGSAVLHSTISCVSRLVPIPQGCHPLGTCIPPGKGWQPSGSAGLLSSSTQGPEHGEKSCVPLGCATNSLCHPGEAGGTPLPASVGRWGGRSTCPTPQSSHRAEVQVGSGSSPTFHCRPSDMIK